MFLKMYQIDAFSDRVFGGNPAAVLVLNKWLPDNLNRTEFLGEFLVRELRLPDLYPSGKHNTFALLQLEVHSRCVPVIGGC